MGYQPINGKTPPPQCARHFTNRRPHFMRWPSDQGWQWLCVGRRAYGQGESPQAALASWEPLAQAITEVQGDEPERDLPPINPQQLTKGA